MQDVLYKYLPYRHAISMLKEEVIKLGTLQEYREMEALDLSRGDPYEGKMDVEDKIKIHDASVDGLPKSAEGIIGLKGGGTPRIIFENVALTKTHISDDLYIFCTSATRHPFLLKLFKADACVSIIDPQFVARLIQDSMLKKRMMTLEDSTYLAECLYFESSRVSFQISEGLPPWRVKDERFSDQDEVRYVFDVIPKEKRIIRVPGIAKFLKLERL